MITIVEIADQIKEKKELKNEPSEEKCITEWKPKECKNYILPPFQIPSVRSVKSTRDKLSKVLAFIDWVKYKRLASGCTITNAFVSAKGERDGNERFNGYYKEDVLKKYGLNLEKDVSSSVPRITLSLNTGVWISEKMDVYRKIYDEYVIRKIESEGLAFKEKIPPFEKVRDAIKELHMRGYFDGESMIGVHTRRVMAEVKNKNEVDEEMKLLQNAIISAEGGCLYGSEIFYHESCIYMEVLKELLDCGYKVWQCYDAWYAAKEGVTQDEFVIYVTELVENKANEYIRHQCVQEQSGT